jgi:hypothetical protein
VHLDIITCPQWNARPPKAEITLCGKSVRIIFHHTAGHHREISNPRDESVAEAIRYAQDIQHYHQDANGWIDSGHNWLVCRNGVILQGRWSTVSAIQHGHMVVSAHCPGQNTQIGIEHEHMGDEPMTPAQRVSSARLMAWIAWHYRRTKVLPVEPHRKYFSTSCPANIAADIPWIHAHAQKVLSAQKLKPRR